MDPRKRRADFWSITTWVLLAILAIFLVLPIGRLLKEAVYTDGHFSLDAFQKFFSKSYYYGTIGNSTKIGLSVMVCSLLLGIPFAYFYTFYTLGGRKILFVLCLLCTMSAPYIGAYAWILLMGNSGLVTQFLKTIGLKGISIYGFGGIVFVQTLKFFPLVVIYMNGAFRDIDASLLEAAESMGCRGVDRFRKVIMGLTMPTILAAALLVFMRSFADFGTPILIGRGYNTFPVLIYNEYLGENGTDYHFAAAISVIAVLVTAAIFLIQKFASNRFKFTINALHPISPKKPHGVGGVLMHVYCYLLVAVAMLPQIYIVNMSFRNYNNAILRPGYSLVNYQKALEKMLMRSIGNTVVISVATLAIIIVIAVLIAYLVVRRSNVITNLGRYALHGSVHHARCGHRHCARCHVLEEARCPDRHAAHYDHRPCHPPYAVYQPVGDSGHDENTDHDRGGGAQPWLPAPVCLPEDHGSDDVLGHRLRRGSELRFDHHGDVLRRHSLQ